MDQKDNQLSLRALALLIQLLARETREIENAIRDAGDTDCSDDQIYLYDCSQAAEELRTLYEDQIQAGAVSNFPAYSDLIAPKK